MAVAKFFEQRASGFSSEIPVEDNGVDVVVVDAAHRFGGRRGFVDDGACHLQDGGRHRTNVRIVFNDEHCPLKAWLRRHRTFAGEAVFTLVHVTSKSHRTLTLSQRWPSCRQHCKRASQSPAKTCKRLVLAPER